MSDALARFYDALAADYHLIFADWRQTVGWQGDLFDRLIRAELGPPPLSVLDCSCGIGTQAIGLAARGYRVRGTDLSPGAVARAAREAEAFGVSVPFGVADLRALASQVAGSFDVVLSADNALPHLRSEEELRLAARNMAAKLRPGGLLVVSIRDYDAALDQKPRTTTPRVYDDPEGRRVVFQLWDWLPDGRTYRLQFLFLQEREGRWRATAHSGGVYRALRREELARIVEEAGFAGLCWHMPDETGYYQLILTARRG
jgi:glycine/sarcosine N-methyltransferase